MTIHWSNIDPKIWDLVALMLCVFGMAVGVRLAFQGRIARARWTRLIEALAAMFFFSALSAVVLFFLVKAPPWLASAIGTAAGVLAFFYADRHVPKLYGVIGMFALGGLAVTHFVLLPDPFDWSIAAAVVLVAAAVGYQVGIWIYAIHVMAGTSLAGAQWVSMAVVGLIEVALDDADKFLAGQVLGWLLPGLSIIFELLTGTVGDFMMAVVGAGVFLVVLCAGFSHQYRHRHETVFTNRETFREMVAQTWRKAVADLRKLAGPVAGAVTVYLCIALMLRSVSFEEKPAPPPVAERASAARSSA